MQSKSPKSAERFVEEFAGDAGCGAGCSVFGQKYGIGDGSLKLSQIGDHRVESTRAKVRSKLVQVTLLIRPTPLEAGHEVTKQLQAPIEPAPNVVDRCGHLHDALGAPVGGFQWDDHEVAGTQGGERREREPGRTVEDDQVVPVPQFVDGFDERAMQVRLLPGALVGQVEPYHGRTGGDDVDGWILGSTNQAMHVGIGRWVKEAFHAGRLLAVAKERVRQVSLRIGVDGQHPLSALMRNRREQPDRVCLPDSTFQVEDRQDCRVRGRGGRHRPRAYHRSGGTRKARAVNVPPADRRLGFS